MQTNALSEEQLANITEAIYQHGYGIIPDFFDTEFIQQLTQRVIESNALKKAGIGRQLNHQRNSDIRRDAIVSHQYIAFGQGGPTTLTLR